MWEESGEICPIRLSQTVGSTRGINKLSAESSSSSSFFTTSLPLETFHPTFSTLISAGSAGFNVRHNEFFCVAVPRIPWLHARICVERQMAENENVWWTWIGEKRENDVWVSQRLPMILLLLGSSVRFFFYMTPSFSQFFFGKFLFLPVSPLLFP